MVDYNNFAKTFSNSRKNMKWEEINYFISLMSLDKPKTVLDVGCGNARLLGCLKSSKIELIDYLGIDLSSGLLGEAKKAYPKYNFLELDMLDLKKINKKFSDIFFIASFHHLKTIEERLLVLSSLHNLLEKGGRIYMTNWALNSPLNRKKYKSSQINGSENRFGSLDYKIKIGVFSRFYHSFSLEELNYLFSKAGFKVLNNYLFENNKNYVSIIHI
ncbi:hypothetical protein CSB08_01390 [Candidatus Gracilibacteria bacterium]|nr:MAG: hypothetical protein CSB08_01390 [Candidatus Gracilibacteria bacterium]PIE85377.1 MAG: hypothetical protein CSA08_02255 [Candidatus Gracilibacteria bacterium]